MSSTQLHLKMVGANCCGSRFISNLFNLKFIVLAFWVALPCLTQVASAQHDHNFREFDSNVVHSPTEMFRDLAGLIGKSKENPLAGLDPELIKKFQESGKDFFEKLDEDQKKKAQEFAKKFLRGDSIDSPEGKALMDELGVSPEMQRRLAEEYGGTEDLADKLNQFRNRFNKNELTQKGSSKSNSGNRDSTNRQQIPGSQSSKRSEGRSPLDSRGKTGAAKGNRGIGNSSGTEPSELGSDNSALNKDEPGSNRRRNRGANGQNPNDPRSTDAESKSAGSNWRTSKDRSRERGELAELPKGVSRRDLDRELGSTSDLRGDSGVGEKDLSQMKREIEELRKRFEKGNRRGAGSTESGTGLDRKSGADGKTADLFKTPDLFDQIDGDGGNRKGSSAEDSDDGAKLNDGNAIAKSGGTGEERRDELFKNWIESDAFKEIREFSGSKGPSEFARESRNKALKGFGKRFRRTLDKTIGGKASQELRKTKLEKVFYEAAKKTMDDGDGDGLGDSLGGALNGVLDRVAEAAKKKNEERRMRESQGQFGSGNRSGRNGGGNPRMGSSGATASLPRGSTGGSSSSGPSLLENLPEIPEIPSFDLKKILMVLALVLFAVFLVFLLFKGFVSEDAQSAKKKFGRSFKKAKISSPKDLVEAVDYFIVSKFGTKSRWWNARYAQEILCADAPGASAKITDLLKDYVRARYTRADVVLSSDLQQKYKSTLQELSEEVVSTKLGDSNRLTSEPGASSSDTPAKG